MHFSYLHCVLCFRQTPEEITAEDLAVAVPGECLFPELSAENEDASHEEEKGILVYTDSQEGQQQFSVYYLCISIILL